MLSDAGLNTISRTFRPDHAESSFMKTRAVPPPPTNIDNLNLSQVFQTSSSSSQPTADFACPNFGYNADRSETSNFVAQSKEDSSSAHSRQPKAAMFKVPYRNTKPVAKVVRQETAPAASGWQLDSSQRPAAYDGEFQAGSGSGFTDVALNTDDNQNPLQHPPTLPNVSSNNFAKTPRFQRSFSGVHEYAAAGTPRQQDSNAVSSSASQHGHVGDTPLALSGSTDLNDATSSLFNLGLL